MVVRLFRLTLLFSVGARSGWDRIEKSLRLISVSRTLDLQREMRSLIFVLLATGAFAGTYFPFLFSVQKRFLLRSFTANYFSLSSVLPGFEIFLRACAQFRKFYLLRR